MTAGEVGGVSEMRREKVCVADDRERPSPAPRRPRAKAAATHRTILGGMDELRRRSIRVLVVWAFVLTTLFLFQQYFS
jgi:hypothetical protein